MSKQNDTVSLEAFRQAVAPSRAMDFYVVDAGVPCADEIAHGLSHAGTVLLMDTNLRPFETIAGVLEAVAGARVMHIIAAGDDSALQLGGQRISADVLHEKADVLARIGAVLSEPENIRLHSSKAIARGSAAFLAELIAAEGAMTPAAVSA